MDDNNGAFEGYGTDSALNNVNHLSLSLRLKLDRLVKYLQSFLTVLERMFAR